MKKAQDAFRTISEVSDVLDTPAHVLRFWESKFYQIKPVKRAGGRRYYRPDDLALLAGIKHLLQDQGLTIRGVQRMLQEHGQKHVAGLGAPLLHNSADTLEGEVTTEAPAPRAAASRPETPETLSPEASAPEISAPKISAPETPTSETPIPAAARAASVTEPPAEPGPLTPAPARERLAHHLRLHPRGTMGAKAARVEDLARRIDRLLDRMSEASGAGRW